MRKFETTGSGIIKWGNRVTLNNGNYVISYLVQHISDTGKKSHFTLKYFTDMELEPIAKDTEIDFTGELRENNFKTKEGEFKSTGLEVIATTIKIMEVFD